ncbi:hypothetical protein HMI01_09560 [Halolactibacillus miurensis]|uniref:Nitrogen regulatory protein P-II n=1 Tax=Halolactibacillus miurensis TaxID=306541 RepID=A0A1I6SAD6_9BACI|nr:MULTISPECIES: P-II family nitrogen regulator [Halolactibacillus]GEM03968.1 hypothetical protein HMI01_09560 [Halolactibacillus miurensis]SFS73906.1 hypothetical protein SAMN05421668_10837 [Halolactibacillus miurensis]
MERINDQKLIMTIVKKGEAKKLVSKIRAVGATGSTILLAEGYRMNERLRIFGIPTHREREVILTIVDEAMFNEVFELLGQQANLGKNTRGVTISIDVKNVLGITMLSGEEIADCSRRRGDESMLDDKRYDLIVTIINSGDAEDVVESTKRHGADGGTILRGRGTGVHEQTKLFNMLIEPEKDIVLTLIEKEKTMEILSGIKQDCELHKPGKGIAFVLETEKTVGLHALLETND